MVAGRRLATWAACSSMAAAAGGPLPEWRTTEAFAHGDATPIDLQTLPALAWFEPLHEIDAARWGGSELRFKDAPEWVARLEEQAHAASADSQVVLLANDGRACGEATATVYGRDASGQLQERATLQPPIVLEPLPATTQGCGRLSVALNNAGTIAALGLSRVDAVFVFAAESPTTWTLRQTLRTGASQLPSLSNATLEAALAGTANAAAVRGFLEPLDGLFRANGLGWSLDMDDSRLVVGAPGLGEPAGFMSFGHDRPVAHGYWYGDRALGRVHVFELQGDGQWAATAELVSPALEGKAAAETLEATWVHANSSNLVSEGSTTGSGVGAAANGETSHHFGTTVKLAFPYLAVVERSMPDLADKKLRPALHVFEWTISAGWQRVHSVAQTDVAKATLWGGELVYAGKPVAEDGPFRVFHAQPDAADEGKWVTEPVSVAGVPAENGRPSYLLPELRENRLALATSAGLFMLERSNSRSTSWQVVSELLTQLEKGPLAGLAFTWPADVGPADAVPFGTVMFGERYVDAAFGQGSLVTFDLEVAAGTGATRDVAVAGAVLCGSVAGLALLAILVFGAVKRSQDNPWPRVVLGAAQSLAYVWLGAVLVSPDAPDALSAFERERASGLSTGFWAVLAVSLAINLSALNASLDSQELRAWVGAAKLAWLLPAFAVAPSAAARLPSRLDPLAVPSLPLLKPAVLHVLSSALVLMYIVVILQFPDLRLGTAIVILQFSLIGATAGPLPWVLMAVAAANLVAAATTLISACSSQNGQQVASDTVEPKL